MDNLQGTPNAFYCEQTQMFGKALLWLVKNH